MRISSGIAGALLLVGAGVGDATTALTHPNYPRSRTIPIHSITEAVIRVVPGRGVKLVFPWVLDEDSRHLPYYGRISNDAVFALDKKAGQNHLVVYVHHISPEIEGEVADLLITTGGYHFSLLLEATFRPSQHYSTVVFALGDKARLALIDDERRKAREQLETERQRLEAELDERAQNRALALVGELAVGHPRSKRIVEEQKLKLANGDRVVAYVEKALRYGSFTVFRLEIENDSNSAPLYIKNIELVRRDDNGNSLALRSAYTFKPKLAERETAVGTLTSNDVRLSQSDDELVLVVTTDRGTVEVAW